MAKSIKNQNPKGKGQSRPKKTAGKTSGKVKTPKKVIEVKGTEGLKTAIKDIQDNIKKDPDYEPPEKIDVVAPKYSKHSNKNAEINHEAFVLEYIKTGCTNATSAYQAVYPKVSKRVATVNGSRLLTNADVQRLLKKHLEPILEERKIDAAFVFSELADNLDVCKQRKKTKREQRMIVPSDIPGNPDQVIVEEYEEIPHYNAKEGNKALEILAKCLGMMKENDPAGGVYVSNVFIGLPDNGRGLSQKDPE